MEHDGVLRGPAGASASVSGRGSQRLGPPATRPPSCRRFGVCFGIPFDDFDCSGERGRRVPAHRLPASARIPDRVLGNRFARPWSSCAAAASHAECRLSSRASRDLASVPGRHAAHPRRATYCVCSRPRAVAWSDLFARLRHAGLVGRRRSLRGGLMDPWTSPRRGADPPGAGPRIAFLGTAMSSLRRLSLPGADFVHVACSFGFVAVAWPSPQRRGGREGRAPAV